MDVVCGDLPLSQKGLKTAVNALHPSMNLRLRRDDRDERRRRRRNQNVSCPSVVEALDNRQISSPIGDDKRDGVPLSKPRKW